MTTKTDINIRNLVVFILIEKFSQFFLERYPADDSLSPPGKKYNRVKNDLKLLIKKKGEAKKPFPPYRCSMSLLFKD